MDRAFHYLILKCMEKNEAWWPETIPQVFFSLFSSDDNYIMRKTNNFTTSMSYVESTYLCVNSRLRRGKDPCRTSCIVQERSATASALPVVSHSPEPSTLLTLLASICFRQSEFHPVPAVSQTY
jgi:hypothetical protein